MYSHVRNSTYNIIVPLPEFDIVYARVCVCVWGDRVLRVHIVHGPSEHETKNNTHEKITVAPNA